MPSKYLFKLSFIAGVLMAIACAAGMFLPGIYSQENLSWAVQGRGQDNISLFTVFPLLLISIYYINKGSKKATLVWLGILMYMTYSYILYSFFMHFGPLFLIYIAILGLSFYTLIGTLIELTKDTPVEWNIAHRKAVSVYLIVNGLLFSALWLVEILPALFSGNTPKSALDVGLWLNPVHVMDLAFFLPATIFTGIFVWQNKTFGNLLAIPIIVFAVLMAAAVISMSAGMYVNGLSETLAPIILMVVNIILGTYLIIKYLRQ